MVSDISISLKENLLKRGYTFRTFHLGGHRFGKFSAPNGWTWLVGRRCYEYPFISNAVRRITQDKQLSYEFAQSQSVTIPATIQTGDINEAKLFLDKYKRIVVKPVAEAAGRGLTLDVISSVQLEKALNEATYAEKSPLLQEQFIGDELRFTIIKGRIASVILRKTPGIVGDGKRTVKALIEEENIARKQLIFPRLSYPQLDEAIIPKELIVSEEVPLDKERVELNKSTLISKGASFYGITDDVNPDYNRIALQLAKGLNSPMIVVDLMVKDYTISSTPSNYVFLEFNTIPALQIYSSIREGDQPDIIAEFGDMVHEYSRLY